MPALIDTMDVYTGRHRLADTQPIALPPAAPMHGRLSRPLRPVPTVEPTTAMPALRLYPALDNGGLTITRRGYAALIAVGAPAVGFGLYGFWAAVGFIGQMVGVQ